MYNSKMGDKDDASQSVQINSSYKRPTVTELSKLNKGPPLDVALDMLKELNSTKAAETANDEPTVISVLMDIRDDMRTFQTTITEQVNRISTRVGHVESEVGHMHNSLLQHQRFLESIDAEKRRKTVIITGLSEDEPLDGDQDENGVVIKISSDRDKVQQIFTKIGQGSTGVSNVEKLGQKQTARDGRIPIRAVKVHLEEAGSQKLLVTNSKKLKDYSEPYNKIFVRKDMHPGVRREFNRLRQSEKTEKDKPENINRTVEYDHVTRTVTVDGVVVDRFRSSFFK